MLNVTKKWLSKATEWSISVLSNIEIQIAAEINQNFTAFDDLGHGPFLKFICQDRKLSKLAEANLSSSSSGIKHEIGKQEIADFTNQCEEAYQMVCVFLICYLFLPIVLYVILHHCSICSSFMDIP